MLLEFRIKGFRSILNEVTLSLMAGNGTDVLPLSLVYGANGSGKSSVLSAFADLKGRALGRAMRFEPHRLSDGVITYLVYFRRNGKNYGYKLSFSKEIYLSEELSLQKNGRYEIVFSGKNEKETRARKDFEDLRCFFEDDLVLLSNESDWLVHSKKIIGKDPRPIVRAFRKLGFSIENIVLDGDDVYFDYGTFRVPLPDESYGVRRLFSYISLIIDALSNGKCIVSDELDSHLHQEVIVQIVREFSSKNGTGAQLVMATHDTELLAMKEVKKDEVWFTRLSGRNVRQGFTRCLSSIIWMRAGTTGGNTSEDFTERFLQREGSSGRMNELL